MKTYIETGGHDDLRDTELRDNEPRETVAEVPSAKNTNRPGVFVKIGNGEWRIGQKIAEEDGRIVIECEKVKDESAPVIKVVRKDLLELWQQQAPRI